MRGWKTKWEEKERGKKPREGKRERVTTKVEIKGFEMRLTGVIHLTALLAGPTHFWTSKLPSNSNIFINLILPSLLVFLIFHAFQLTKATFIPYEILSFNTSNWQLLVLFHRKQPVEFFNKIFHYFANFRYLLLWSYWLPKQQGKILYAQKCFECGQKVTLCTPERPKYFLVEDK